MLATDPSSSRRALMLQAKNSFIELSQAWSKGIMKYSEKADQYTALSSFLINGTPYF